MNRRTGLVVPLAPVVPLALALAAVLVAGGCSRSGDPAPAGGAAAPTAAPATSATAGPATTAAPATGDPADPADPATTGRTPAPVRYRFPVAGCRARYANAHHDYPAADMFTQRNCTFVAPVAGRVDEVTRTDRWDPATNRGADRGGRSVSLVGVDGVRYYGSHLEAVLPGVTPGLRVRAGQPLGRIGNSGSARVTDVHLHFAISWPTRPGIWWIRRGVVAPARYLDAWRAGGDLSPARAVQAALEAAGSTVPPCRSYC
jgi:murein DD-endopeptidase MepM/ murein hydrolase activator NlpD